MGVSLHRRNNVERGVTWCDGEEGRIIVVLVLEGSHVSEGCKRVKCTREKQGMMEVSNEVGRKERKRAEREEGGLYALPIFRR